jgi:hypothetical protein
MAASSPALTAEVRPTVQRVVHTREYSFGEWRHVTQS